tara:strand:- start:327 stop:719 length:393 start_codon:yes stop_codon:yes gene_type:complete
MKKKIKPQVKFFKNQFFFHKDKRRTISGLAGNLKFNQNFKQMKIIKVTNKSIKKTVIGNHRHKYNSNQWEFIYVLHESSSKPIFEFRYKNYENSVKKKKSFFWGLRNSTSRVCFRFATTGYWRDNYRNVK